MVYNIVMTKDIYFYGIHIFCSSFFLFMPDCMTF